MNLALRWGLVQRWGIVRRTNSKDPGLLPAGIGQHALLKLHSALEFDELWAALQDLFEALVPHDTLVMSVNYLDWKQETSTRRYSSAKSRHPHDEMANKIVAREGHAFFQPFLEANRGIAAYQHSQLVPDPRKIERTPYYRRYMRKYGWRYSAHLLFWRGKEVETSFALRRRADQGDFTPREMAMLNAVHPHIKVAFDRMRTFEQERQRRKLLEGFYRAKPEAVLFLDWNLEPVYSSQDALALCAVWNLGGERARSYSPQAVFVIPDEIRSACEELRREWKARAPGSAPPEGPQPMRQLLSREGGHEAFVTLRPEKGGTLTKPIFVIRLRLGEGSAQGPMQADESSDRLLHQLSPRERELAKLVCAGLTNKEIAAQLRKTEGSVKVQLSGIFQKLRVSNRAKLIIALRG